MKILIIGGAGYIGTALTDHLRQDENNQVIVADSGEFGNLVKIDPLLVGDYYYLDDTDYKSFDVVVLLAGNSSVAMCERQGRWLSFENNVYNFVHLLEDLNKDQKFIYASSASIYSPGVVFEGSPIYKPKSIYDLTKAEIDLNAQLTDLNYYGLRFGTVCGFSRNWRTDVVYNSMALSKFKRNYIEVSNPHLQRPILWMQDLVRAVETIIKSDKRIPGIYNLSSFNTRVGDIAQDFDCEIRLGSQKAFYNMVMNCQKFIETFEFEFKGTSELIIKDIVNNWTNIEIMKDRK